MPIVKEKLSLTGNQLKIIAMIAMTCDHVGLQLLPQLGILRVVGRLALPIYAFMIAEGCRYTRDRRKYLLRMATLAAVCQLVYFMAMGSLYQCILVTFSLSVLLIWLWESGGGWKFYAAIFGTVFLCIVLPELMPGTDFQLDYGIWGVMLPVLVYVGSVKGLVIGLLLLALELGGLQWFAFAAVPLLMLYNGKRGKANIGRLFYFYYPAHLVVIYLMGLML